MTHKDIYTKFLIEYDKANVTSSYPSLTEYEAATILDKAYLALIGQKVTGNNVRRAPFEADIKSVSDLQPLVKTKFVDVLYRHPSADNSICFNLPEDFMYYVSGYVGFNDDKLTVQLINHEVADKFKVTAVNRPWIKNTVGYIQDDQIILLYDNYKYGDNSTVGDLGITYIKRPKSFVNEGTFSRQFALNESLLNSTDTIG